MTNKTNLLNEIKEAIQNQKRTLLRLQDKYEEIFDSAYADEEYELVLVSQMAKDINELLIGRIESCNECIQMLKQTKKIVIGISAEHKDLISDMANCLNQIKLVVQSNNSAADQLCELF